MAGRVKGRAKGRVKGRANGELGGWQEERRVERMIDRRGKDMGLRGAMSCRPLVSCVAKSQVRGFHARHMYIVSYTKCMSLDVSVA